MRRIMRDLVEFHVAGGGPVDRTLPVTGIGEDPGEGAKASEEASNAHDLIDGIAVDIGKIATMVYAVVERMKGAGAEDAALGLLRVALIIEEASEVFEAMRDGDDKALADGLVDLIYVTVGTAVTYGIDLSTVWIEVHDANMRKFGPGAYVDESGKLRKPEGWEGPDLDKALGRRPPGNLRARYCDPMTLERAERMIERWNRRAMPGEAPTPRAVRHRTGEHWPAWVAGLHLVTEAKPTDPKQLPLFPKNTD